MATHTHTTPRRRLLSTAPAILALSGAAVAATTAQNPDAELIRACQRFAEAELKGWYAYVTTNNREAAARYEDTPPSLGNPAPN